MGRAWCCRLHGPLARTLRRVAPPPGGQEEHDPRGWSIDKNESGAGAGDQQAGGFVTRTDLTPQEYACKACDWVRCGASIVGGCCGIGPETMRVVSSEVTAWAKVRNIKPRRGRGA